MNTRWHWSTRAGSPEPAIPWDAWLFPDGTPVSHTEAARLRQYTRALRGASADAGTGTDTDTDAHTDADSEFLAFADFLPTNSSDGGQPTVVSRPRRRRRRRRLRGIGLARSAHPRS